MSTNIFTYIHIVFWVLETHVAQPGVPGRPGFGLLGWRRPRLWTFRVRSVVRSRLADPTRGNPAGLPSRVASAKKKKRHPAKRRVSSLFVSLVEERPRTTLSMRREKGSEREWKDPGAVSHAASGSSLDALPSRSAFRFWQLPDSSGNFGNPNFIYKSRSPAAPGVESIGLPSGRVAL